MQNNYNTCTNKLVYYNNLQEENKKLKEEKESYIQKYNTCASDLYQCYSYCPTVDYNGISSEMQSTINEIIVYSYNKYTDFESRAKYVSDRMNQVYKNAYWSCICAKTTSYYGYYVWYINNLYYIYTYKNIKWIVFVGTN